jgi:hypothetical protein
MPQVQLGAATLAAAAAASAVNLLAALGVLILGWVAAAWAERLLRKAVCPLW